MLPFLAASGHNNYTKSVSSTCKACAEVNKTMQELTCVSFDSGKKNKDMTKSRQARNWKDV